MSSQLSAQAMTAQTAITRMSISRWSILPWQRGSSTTPRCRTRLSMDMILSSPARGHGIIHQARASDRNFMRLPCFGGVVPYSFVATKAITDPLVEPDLAAPAGWSDDLGRRMQDAVLFGFSAFSLEDARRTGVRLLEHGPARVKPVRETGGLGQTIVADAAALEQALAFVDPAEVSRDGVVIEENLTEVTTYSVGQVRVADLEATYYGMQRLTPDHRGAAVFGGSDLVIARGGFEALLALDLSEAARRAIAQARTYDAVAAESFPGMILSRRNYDAARGLDAHGR